VIITQDLRRRCIIGAVYSGVLHVCGTPSLPPVIPRIDGKLKEGIIHLLTDCDIKNSGTIKMMRDDIAAYKRWGTTADLREAKRIQYEIDKLLAEHTPILQRDAEIQVSNLAFCRGIEKIEINTPRGYEEGDKTAIVATTCSIIIQGSENGITNTMGGTHLGKYRIAIDTTKLDLYSSVSIQRYFDVGVRDSGYSSGRIHPHISGNVCWGDFINILSETIKKMKVDVLLGQIIQYLATYNRTSPYSRLSTFKGGGSHYCGYRP
jgi:hypothetical protein